MPREVRNVNGYLAPALTVDALLVKGNEEVGHEVLLIRRAREPFLGAWAIPGGFVEVGERVEAACLRELAEETGLQGRVLGLVGVYSDPARDPRGHTVSVAFACEVRGVTQVEAGDDAAEARWFRLDGLPPVAFDHAEILDDFRAWLAENASRRTGATEEDLRGCCRTP